MPTENVYNAYEKIFVKKCKKTLVISMMFNYRPQGVCSQEFTFDIDENNTIRDLVVIGGCHGNLQGIAKLLKGMNVQEVIERLEGIRCGFKNTSCPDQIAQALKKYLEG